MKTLKKRVKYVRSGVFNVNFEHISYIFLLPISLTLNRQMPAETVLEQLLHKFTIFIDCFPTRKIYFQSQQKLYQSNLHHLFLFFVDFELELSHKEMALFTI